MSYYVNLSNGQTKTFEQIPDNAYIQMGLQHPYDAGKVSLFHLDEGVTTLSPIINSKDGSYIIIENPKHHGKKYGEIQK